MCMAKGGVWQRGYMVKGGGVCGKGGHAWQGGACMGYDKIQRYDQ